LHTIFSESQSLREYVDVHLIVDQFPRQFNYWRNVARLFASSDYVFTLDVDFKPLTDIKKHFMTHEKDRERLENGCAMFVVPAFENRDDFKDAFNVKTKNQLVSLYKDGYMKMFHDRWEKGHGATNYAKWINTNESYSVSESDYNSSYEPYVIMKKHGFPW